MQVNTYKYCVQENLSEGQWLPDKYNYSTNITVYILYVKIQHSRLQYYYD